MGCSNCGPEGCGNKGHCASGGCNKMNTYDWITTLDIQDPESFDIAEVSFKQGAKKEFFNLNNTYAFNTGDMVVVDCSPGYDVGQITLMGDLVRLQMRKKSMNPDKVSNRIIRHANDRDLDRLKEARILDNRNLARARAIARTLGIEMKLGDIEYQADLKKATFYYTANGRIDFRELVKEYAREFKIKIEMRQIGSRQESARIGGLGSCGRELCCSTWLSDFRSVNTSAARYQNIAINQTKLSGQCGRLKCCLNYELDTYMDALKDFPKHADTLITKKGKANLVKKDIFKGLMFYAYEEIGFRGAFHPLDKEKVKEILAMNKKGIHPDDLSNFYEALPLPKEEEIGYGDVTGVVELPMEKRRKKRGKKRGGPRKPRNKDAKGPSQEKRSGDGKRRDDQPRDGQKKDGQKSRRPKNRNNRKRGSGPKNNSNTEK